MVFKKDNTNINTETMESIKEINIKNRTYYLFDDMINIKSFDSNLLKIDKTSHTKIDIY